jgi:UDP-N-acetylmuramate--alanine ligase
MQKAPHKSLHFIGIGGTGMRPLAEIALAQGYQVSGSDQAASSSLRSLQEQGARITLGHRREALPDEPSAVVVSTAIGTDNPEVLAAQERGWPILHRSELLHTLMQGRKAICVSGTHGKTSTTAMLAYMLEALGQEPTAAIGGEIVGRDRNALVGKGPYFVAECDESDGSFLRYDPFISIVTNIDLDHLDYYKDLEGLKRGFLSFVEKTSADGWAIFGWDNAAAREVAHLFEGQRLSFGTRIGSEVRGLSFNSKGNSAAYEAVVDKQLIQDTAPVVGRHNLQNILCCLAVASVLELDVVQAAAALRSYPGVGRRFSLVAETDRVRIFDDYAHNPGKIRSCIEGAREAFPRDELIIIFQPHRYSRLETMYNETMGSFGAADEVFVLPVYAAGETSQRVFSPESIAKDMSIASQTKALAYDEALLGERLLNPKKATVLITIGAGDVWRLGLEWKDRLYEQKAQEERTSS